MPSIGYSYAVLNGRATGDPEKAKEFLDSRSTQQRILQNRHENKTKITARKNFLIGRRYRSGREHLG